MQVYMGNVYHDGGLQGEVKHLAYKFKGLIKSERKKNVTLNNYGKFLP